MSATTIERPEAAQRRASKPAPLWNVVLLDDDDHTYTYVVEMLQRLFGHGVEQAYRLAREVDCEGRVVVLTAPFERAEFKRDQILAYGRDWRLDRSAGSMSAVLEPAMQPT